jgi:HEAT repeat protein
MRSSEPVPYDSYEEWIDAGRKIEGIEQILIGFAKNNTTKVSTGIIFQALGFLGSEDSVPVLINALENEGLDRTKRVYAANALGRIGNPLAVEPLCKIVSTTEDAFLRNNAILALGMIGDTKAISVLEAVLRKPQLDQFDRIEIQKILDELLKK